MATVYFYVGLSGSGKTTLAYSCLNDNEVVIDSDEMRRKLFGDENYQGNNELLFATMLKDTIYWLKKGYNVHYVATNLVIKHRVHFIKEVRRQLPETVMKCVVCVTPPEACFARNRKRDRKVPEFVIIRQLKSFQTPVKGEGWDSISVFKCANYDERRLKFKIWEQVESFGDQHNPHHNNTLAEHSWKTAMNYLTKIGEFYTNDDADVAFWHDVGKLFTKTEDENGVWHYYCHENVGAYYALLMGMSINTAALINYHMACFKNSKRIREVVGEEMWKKLLMLNEADRQAH